MSEEATTATQADADSQSQADTPNQQAESQADEVQTVSLDELKKVRSEAANLRKRLKEAEAKVSEFETATQSDEERRSAELTSLQERAAKAEERLRIANGLNQTLSKAGNAIDGEVLYRYIRDDITFDDDGSPENIDDLIAQARESKPTLFQRGSADGAARSSEKGYEPKPGVERIAHAYEQAAKQR